MTAAFAFHEPQPVIDDGDEGLPIVAVYPAGAAYLVTHHADGLVTVILPSGDTGDSLESTFRRRSDPSLKRQRHHPRRSSATGKRLPCTLA